MSLDDFDVERGAWAKAGCLKTLVTIIRDNALYRHGLTANEVRQFFPKVMHAQLATYDNRLRDLANEKPARAGRHDVHGERHFYPLCLDFIDHSKCSNCSQKP